MDIRSESPVQRNKTGRKIEAVGISGCIILSNRERQRINDYVASDGCEMVDVCIKQNGCEAKNTRCRHSLRICEEV